MNPHRMTEGEFLAILSQIQPTDCGCRVWPYTLDNHGYPRVKVSGHPGRGNRVSLGIKLGRPVGKDNFACHTCDNRACIEPDHLYEGNNRTNWDDCIARGRTATGDKNGQRLHPERIARGDRNGRRKHPERYSNAEGDNHWTRKNPELLSRISGDSHWTRRKPGRLSGENNGRAKLTKQDVYEIRVFGCLVPVKDLSVMYGVSRNNISQILSGKIWKDVIV